MRNIKIIDATLREGFQAPGVHFTEKQVIDIAKCLSRVGVDMLEIGHPLSSNDSMNAVKAVVKANLGIPVLAHARAHKLDIEAVKESGADWVGIFLGVNEMAQKTKTIGINFENLIENLIVSITDAKVMGLKVRYTVEDGSRTPISRLFTAFSAAISAGADRICLADSVGILEPAMTSKLVSLIRQEFPNTELEVHFHDDRGLALANGLAAIDSGANWISVSVNGIGERCGISDLGVLAVNMDYRGDRTLSYESGEMLNTLSRMVSAYSRQPVDRSRPIFGRDAFHHTSRLHVKAVNKNPDSYQWIKPEMVGRTCEISPPAIPWQETAWQTNPEVISATELKYHRKGPGSRYVMIDERFVPDCRQYCIVREIPLGAVIGRGHVDQHTHICDSLFMFLGTENEMKGLEVEVNLGGVVKTITSPSSVFIPSGMPHSYRVLSGQGLYINHVLNGEYNSSLLETPEFCRDEQPKNMSVTA